jgi:hypothetical protein
MEVRIKSISSVRQALLILSSTQSFDIFTF